MQNKIKLFKLIEQALNRGPRQIVLYHHNRDFLNECVQTVSEKNIKRFKAGKPIDAMIIPISLNDDTAQKIAQMNITENAKTLLLENHALSKMVTRTFKIADKRTVDQDEELKSNASILQQRLQRCGKEPTQKEINELAGYYLNMEDFADYCEHTFNKATVHVLFTDIQNLSKEFQMHLNSYIQWRMRTLKLGYAHGADDLKTRYITENHFLKETDDVNYQNIDSKYWHENIKDETKYEYPAEAFEDCDAYIRKLQSTTHQHKLPLRDYI